MISKNKIKLIHSLEHKKFRIQEALFIAEGNKLVEEVLKSDFKVVTLICTDDFYESLYKLSEKPGETIVATHDEIRKCSLQKNPQRAIALCQIPDRKFVFGDLRNNLTLAIDGIQDPGNLGTIIRIADWFGIKTICASETTVDVFNPKVVQASMGAVLRVRVFYMGLREVITKANFESIQTFGTFLTGKSIYQLPLPESAIVVMGNEGQGITHDVEKVINQKIFIPPYKSILDEVSESLNVSSATAIICSEFRRQILAGYSK